MGISIGEKIEAQKRLAAEFGVDETTWASMTQKQLDEFWETHCSNHVLVHVKGKGLGYVPFDSIEAKGGIQ